MMVLENQVSFFCLLFSPLLPSLLLLVCDLAMSFVFCTNDKNLEWEIRLAVLSIWLRNFSALGGMQILSDMRSS